MNGEKGGGYMLLIWAAAAVVAVLFMVLFIKKILAGKTAVILSICMLPAAVMVNLMNLFILLIMPPFASRTTDEADYMAVDRLVE